MTLVDHHGRCINYLRLSVTDRCNLRCRYCMPADGVPKLFHEDVLSYEDLYRISQAAVSLGIEKVRVTGGEPLVRKGLVAFLERLASIPGLKELVLTTNGLLLGEMATALRSAGVQRLNISLDSLKADKFAHITRGGDLHKVFAGIEAAERAGFPAVKLNMVVMRGVNDDEIVDFAALTLEKAYNVRYIEYMPTILEEGWRTRCITGEEVLQRLGERYELEAVDETASAGPARNYKIRGAVGSLGVITPISSHFCSSCNRIRVTASGMAKACLFAKQGFDLKPYLACGDNELLRDTLRDIATGKPARHLLSIDNPGNVAFAMSQIGG